MAPTEGLYKRGGGGIEPVLQPRTQYPQQSQVNRERGVNRSTEYTNREQGPHIGEVGGLYNQGQIGTRIKKYSLNSNPNNPHGVR